MGLGAKLKDSDLWRRNCAAIIDQLGAINGGVSSGSANAYVITAFTTITDLVDGETYSFIPNFTNTGAATVTISGSSSKNIKKPDGTTALSAGDVPSGIPATIRYDLANDVFRLLGPQLTAGTWTPSPTAESGGYTSTTVTYAQWERSINNWVKGLIRFTGTTGGTPAYLSFSLPFTAATLGANQVSPCSTQDTTTVPGFCSVQDGGTTARVVRSDLAAYGTGASRGAFCNFTYLAA